MADNEEGASYREPASVDAIFCEVCDLPHRPGAATCEDCGHKLGTVPDWDGLRYDRDRMLHQAVIAALAVIGIAVLSFCAFGGRGYILGVAPMAWGARSAYRCSVLTKRIPKAD